MNRIIARVITEIFAPTVLVTVFLIGTGAAKDGWNGAGFGLLAAVFAVLIPFAGIVFATRKGKVSDHHVRDRRQRLPIILAAMASAIVGFALLLILHAPKVIIVGLAGTLLGMIVVGAVNSFWKLSVHNAVATFVAVAVVGSFGWMWWPLLVLPIAVGWSRVVLKDHTIGQVIAGVPAGAVVAIPYLLVGV